MRIEKRLSWFVVAALLGLLSPLSVSAQKGIAPAKGAPAGKVSHADKGGRAQARARRRSLFPVADRARLGERGRLGRTGTAEGRTPRRYTRRFVDAILGESGYRGWRIRLKTNAGVPKGEYTFRNMRTGERFTTTLMPSTEHSVEVGYRMDGFDRLPSSKDGDRIEVRGPEGYRYVFDLPSRYGSGAAHLDAEQLAHVQAQMVTTGVEVARRAMLAWWLPTALRSSNESAGSKE